MKLIFVSGLADIDKATLIDLALQRSGRKSDFTLVDFDKLQDTAGELKEAGGLDAARRVLSRFYDKIEKTMITRLKEQKGDLIMNGFLALDTKFGYMRALPDGFFRTFKPDIIVIFEKAADALEKGDAGPADLQRVNRHYGTIYASTAGSALKIIKFRDKKMIEAVKELSEVLKD